MSVFDDAILLLFHPQMQCDYIHLLVYLWCVHCKLLFYTINKQAADSPPFKSCRYSEDVTTQPIRYHRSSKLQALVYHILPPGTAITGYVIDL